MAVQVRFEELEGCKSYLSWLKDKAGIFSSELVLVLFETDFEWSVPEDEIRARDALLLRELYATEVGEDNKKGEKEIDRIWKSIHGKCSVLEVIVKMASDLDDMVNEGEEGAMTSRFVDIMLKNVGWLVLDDEDFDHYSEKTKQFWQAKTEHFLKREYDANGKNGGLFFVDRKIKDGSKQDFRKLPIWDQMNIWLEDALDEDGEFECSSEQSEERHEDGEFECSSEQSEERHEDGEFECSSEQSEE